MLRTKVSFQKGAGAGLTDSPGQSQERPDPTCLPASCGLLAMLSAVCDDHSGRPRLMLALLWRGMAHGWLRVNWQGSTAQHLCPWVSLGWWWLAPWGSLHDGVSDGDVASG